MKKCHCLCFSHDLYMARNGVGWQTGDAHGNLIVYLILGLFPQKDSWNSSHTKLVFGSWSVHVLTCMAKILNCEPQIDLLLKPTRSTGFISFWMCTGNFRLVDTKVAGACSHFGWGFWIRIFAAHVCRMSSLFCVNKISYSMPPPPPPRQTEITDWTGPVPGTETMS